MKLPFCYSRVLSVIYGTCDIVQACNQHVWHYDIVTSCIWSVNSLWSFTVFSYISLSLTSCLAVQFTFIYFQEFINVLLFVLQILTV